MTQTATKEGEKEKRCQNGTFICIKKSNFATNCAKNPFGKLFVIHQMYKTRNSYERKRIE